MGKYILLASGPSLTKADCDLAAESGYCTLAVSDAYRLIDADYHYACDQAWWEVHLHRVRARRLYTQYEDAYTLAWARSRGLTALESKNLPGLGRTCLHQNGNSGAQAINLAYLLGARRILLLGFDMQHTGGLSHFFGDHPPELRQRNPAAHVRRFDELAEDLKAAGVEVLNCTPETALYQFQRANLREAL